MVSTKFSSILTLTAAANALTLASLSLPVSATPRVDPAVHRTLRQQTTVNLIVTLKDGTASPLNAVQEASFETRGDKIQALVDRLQKHAATSQSEVTKMVVQESGGATLLFSEATSFWITNQLFFKDATLELVEKLAGLSSVGEIQEAARIPIASASAAAATVNTTATASIEWGIKKVQAPDAWAKGYTGQGIVVGGIDTGVRATHEILRNNWRKDHGWFDGLDKRAAPYDDDGHGTHTLGTAVGSNGFGVAPGASWIGCRACNTNYCTNEGLLACGQFMLCPTDPDGKNADCSKAPHVVNNSWGGSSSSFYVDVIAAWSAAGIIPVFSGGNSGSLGCSSVGSPGDFSNVISVGATTTDDKLGGLSSKGPSKKGLIKPDISAPGINVRSATYTGDADYKAIDGTSHAAPHVAGVIALALSANRNLTFPQVRDILTTTTVRTPTLQASGYTCGGTPDTTYPNNQYGYGRVDALAATSKAAAMK